jgi:hypothetical protein
MKIAVSVLAAALLFAAPAFAQQPPDATPNPAMRQAFQQMRSQMENVRRTERSQILGALTPAHRALLGSVAGELATAVEPNYDAAAKRLDSVLSAGESQAIVRAAQNADRQRRTIAESMMPPPPPDGQVMSREFRRFEGGPQSADAGRILLRTMIGSGMPLGPMLMTSGGMMRP